VVAVPPVDRRLLTRRIASEPIVLVSAVGHVQPEGEPYKLVLPSPRNGLRTVIDGYIHQAHLPVARTVELDSLHGMLELVRYSDWVTLLSVTAIAKELARGEIKVEPTNPPTELGYYLIYPARRALSVAASRFVERLEAGFAASKADWARRLAAAGASR
jgi:DNA-binding transcriptional LysR family regulator